MYRPAQRLAEIAPFHVVELLTRARQLEAEGRDIIHMEVGEPDFPTPEPIAKAAIAAIQGGKTLYTEALGLPELREAIAGFYRQRYGVAVPAKRIAVTNGASGALNLAFACLADPGSEWLLADPGYPCNRHILRTYEGRPLNIPVGPQTNFQPTPELLQQHWTAQTAGLLVASPANPTGTLLTLDEIRALAAVCRQKNAHFLVDEIYHGLTYECNAPSACAAGDDIWVINSFSKYFQMTGWRLGWMVIPEPYVRDVEKLAQNLVLCPSTPAQYAALAAFEPATIAILEARRSEFRKRRDFLAPALESIGFRITARPEGAFYLYCDCSALSGDSFALARDLLEKTGVAATPGLDFGSNEPEKHIRFAYTTGVDRLAEAAERLRRYFGR
ncbi:pyridoxal phosphate-dependent aminotransferase [Dechloromonas denitrificans]|uniref:pyridoxal phosphate-dependent aminotransferase n=1 Tax=Dechloromonas denitrificans TaxID=281362 RepID=UPI001CF80016|nr:pyridoxal phosphate-dependent aminotransferase [Dechloromonas denitrificans]UCV04658.1 pyridoxal phosphate-dependent aminotransferase [Dechloromonas denitrificans]UCV09026.1 pyridoxal phosphate-dependent aminotransferase [Dechloromonas denitrificans]